MPSSAAYADYVYALRSANVHSCSKVQLRVLGASGVIVTHV